MIPSALRFSLTALLIVFSGTISLAQVPDTGTDTLRKDAVNIFIDCQRCDMNYIRDEIPYVNYVRDVKEADVYILETRQSTGSGGSKYTITFHGQYNYAGLDDTLIYNSRPDDPGDITREGRTQMLRLGLMRFVAKSPLFDQVDIQSKIKPNREELEDNWNYWVFEIDFDPNFEIEESRREITWENSLMAARITPGWKIELEFDQEFNKTRIIDEDEDETFNKRYWSQNNLIVKSLSEHWSAGLRFDLTSSSYRNIDRSFDFTPAIEYNIFPYSEATRRQLRFLYSIGYSFNDYIDTTIFGMVKENLWEQQLDIAFRVQQKWGSVNLSLEASSYLHDFSKNRIELDASVRIRLLKGLSFQLRGSAAAIHNQLHIAKGDLSDADILLELQELQTEFSFDGGVGFVYTFGSIYNNIVNPRFSR
ncbi:MAG: hypothetical protein V2I37_13325 [Marinilabiliaceae bacterium]|jgi:hypothetical protein|nr:hypothetical protein [Marinilabiliaceae bacterium]